MDQQPAARPRPEQVSRSNLDEKALNSRLFRQNGVSFSGNRVQHKVNMEDRFKNLQPLQSPQSKTQTLGGKISSPKTSAFSRTRNTTTKPKAKELKLSLEKKQMLLRRPPKDTRPSEIEVPVPLQALLGERMSIRPLTANTGYSKQDFSERGHLPRSRAGRDMLSNTLTSQLLAQKQDKSSTYTGITKASRVKAQAQAGLPSNIDSKLEAESEDVPVLSEAARQKQEYEQYLRSPFSFIDQVIESPYTEEFVYLNSKGPYNLEIVKHTAIRPEDYYTMSRAGQSSPSLPIKIYLKPHRFSISLLSISLSQR